ncbi:MAG: TIGR02281 family clan AA aspartic protease [Pseudomonadota bacterium]
MSTRRTGLVMMALAWIVGGVLLAMLFNRSLLQRANPNSAPDTVDVGGRVEVRLSANRQGHFVASGQINAASAVFLLDTGATDVVVSNDLALRAGLRRGRATRASTANGTITVYDTQIDRVSLGGITLRNVNASINPNMQGDRVLLGMSFLGQLELTQRGGELLLRQP